MEKHKKGQTQILALIPGMIILIVVGFSIIGIGAQVLEELRTQNNPSTLSSINNETHWANTTSGFNLSNAVDPPIGGAIVVNNSNTIASSNYVTQLHPGNILQINITNAGSVNNTNIEVGVNYTARTGSDNYAVNTTTGSLNTMTNFTSLAATTGLVAAAVLVLMLLAGGLVLVTRR